VVDLANLAQCLHGAVLVKMARAGRSSVRPQLSLISSPSILLPLMDPPAKMNGPRWKCPRCGPLQLHAMNALCIRARAQSGKECPSGILWMFRPLGRHAPQLSGAILVEDQ